MPPSLSPPSRSSMMLLFAVVWCCCVQVALALVATVAAPNSIIDATTSLDSDAITPPRAPLLDLATVSFSQLNSNGYIVQFHGEPSPSRCHQSAERFRRLATKQSLFWEERRAFSRLFNGMAISVDCLETLRKISELDVVKALWPNEVHYMAQALPSNNVLQAVTGDPTIADDGASSSSSSNSSNSDYKGNLEDIHRVTGVADIRSRFNLTGRGVKIGIIDSGVDYRHPYLGACWKTPGCPFQYGWDFVGDNYSITTGSPPVPDDDPLDTCFGHGTNVAGILAANGSMFTGVAPGVTLGIYRTVSCADGQTTTDILIQAMERAARDGMDIVNMSFGTPSSWPENALTIAASNLIKRGTMVLAAVGNSGQEGMHTIFSPASGAGVIGTGSFEAPTISFLAIGARTASGDDLVLPVSLSASSAAFIFKNPIPIVSVAAVDPTMLGCMPYNGDFAAGKVVFVFRGDCTMAEKALYAQNAGAVGILISNNEASSMTPIVNNTIKIPVGGMDLNDGLKLAQELEAGSVDLVSGERAVTYPNPSSGSASFFTSFGPGPELTGNPSVLAPGSQIISTAPINLGSFSTKYGTSIAVPYMTGIMSLMLEGRRSVWPAHNRNRNLSVDDLQAIVKEHSTPARDPTTGMLVSVFCQGSGRSNVTEVFNTQVVAHPPELRFNYTLVSTSQSATINLRNILDNEGVFYIVSDEPAESISPFYPNGTYAAPPYVDPTGASAKVTVIGKGSGSGRAGFIRPNESAQVTVRISPPRGLNADGRWFYSGYIVVRTLTYHGKRDIIRIPYSSYLGDYRQFPIMDPSDSILPLLTYDDEDIVKEGGEYDIDKDHSMYLTLRTIAPTRQLKIRLMFNDTGETAGYLPRGYSEYIGRNMVLNGPPLYQTVLDGTEFTDPAYPVSKLVQPGAYYVQIDALRPFGDVDTEADYQSWRSPSFILRSVNVTVPIGNNLTLSFVPS